MKRDLNEVVNEERDRLSRVLDDDLSDELDRSVDYVLEVCELEDEMDEIVMFMLQGVFARS